MNRIWNRRKQSGTKCKQRQLLHGILLISERSIDASSPWRVGIDPSQNVEPGFTMAIRNRPRCAHRWRQHGAPWRLSEGVPIGQAWTLATEAAEGAADFHDPLWLQLLRCGGPVRSTDRDDGKVVGRTKRVAACVIKWTRVDVRA